jgi:hypothetical protein
MNGYKELETCGGVMLMGLTSSRTVFNHLNKLLWSLVCMLHMSLFTLWIRIRLSCLWFKQVEKKKCISLVTYMFYPHFVVKNKFWVWGIWRWFHCMRNSTPTKQNWSSCWPWDFFNFQILVVIEELWHRPTSIYLYKTFSCAGCHAYMHGLIHDDTTCHDKVHLANIPELISKSNKICIIFRHAKIFKNYLFSGKWSIFSNIWEHFICQN